MQVHYLFSKNYIYFIENFFFQFFHMPDNDLIIKSNFHFDKQNILTHYGILTGLYYHVL